MVIHRRIWPNLRMVEPIHDRFLLIDTGFLMLRLFYFHSLVYISVKIDAVCSERIAGTTEMILFPESDESDPMIVKR